MLDTIETIRECVTAYIGSGMYIALYLIGLVYIWKNEKNSKIRNFFVTFSILILFVILNPIFCKVVSKVVTNNVYWRMFWLLPIGLTISYCATRIILECKKTSDKVKLFIATILIIMISGKFIYNKNNYFRVDNWYKIPQEAFEICVAISEDNLENKLVMSSPRLIPYFRQYNANINLMYGRVPTGYEDNELVVAFNNGNMEYVIPICLEKKCNYIVIDKGIILDNDIGNSGYILLTQTDNYNIYKLIK